MEIPNDKFSLSGFCPYESKCQNAGTWKCQFCITHDDPLPGATHFRCFKDKQYYAKTIPYIHLKSLFQRCKEK